MKDRSIATYAMLKRLLPLSAVILLTAAYQDVGRITPPHGEPLAELPGPNFSMTTTASGEPAVSAGLVHSCGLTTAGAAYCWGNGAFGQLGDGTNTTSDGPVAVTGGLSSRTKASRLISPSPTEVWRVSCLRLWGVGPQGK